MGALSQVVQQNRAKVQQLLRSLLHISTKVTGAVDMNSHHVRVPLFWDLMLRLFLARALVIKHCLRTAPIFSDPEFQRSLDAYPDWVFTNVSRENMAVLDADACIGWTGRELVGQQAREIRVN